jgi:hypothetical protein
MFVFKLGNENGKFNDFIGTRKLMPQEQDKKLNHYEKPSISLQALRNDILN